jgi:hypothetical protein
MKALFLTCALLLGLMLGCTFTVSGGGDGDGTHEFYWDDGTCSQGWMWYTGGNYWYVVFDEEKTSDQPGTVSSLGAYVYPNWPDETYQGVDLHVLSDSGGVPGADLGYAYVSGSGWHWTNVDVDLDSGVFWVGFQQIGNYPACDALGFDAEGTGHSWGWVDDWITWGDAMLRCRWEGK